MRERREERIALGVDLVTVESLNRLAEQPRVRGQDLAVAVAERCNSRVDPSISVNRNVTVPVGRSGIPIRQITPSGLQRKGPHKTALSSGGGIWTHFPDRLAYRFTETRELER
jgi:hypothetical protein